MKAPRQDIYNAVIRRMVSEALTARHADFALKHGKDSEEALAAYIRQCAHKLGHVPHQKEVIGWPMLTERFGTWEKALGAAHLPLPRTPGKPEQFAVVVEETRRQKQIYRERKNEKKLRAQQRAAEQARRKKENASRSKAEECVP